MLGKVRKWMRLFIPSLNGKLRWCKTEAEVLDTLTQYLPKPASDSQIEDFLQRNAIKYRRIKHSDGEEGEEGEEGDLCLFVNGPTVWDGYFPFSSHFQILIKFEDKDDYALCIGHWVNHL